MRRISEEAQRYKDDWNIACFGQSGFEHLASRLPHRGLRNFRDASSTSYDFAKSTRTGQALNDVFSTEAKERKNKQTSMLIGTGHGFDIVAWDDDSDNTGRGHGIGSFCNTEIHNFKANE
uniref:Bm9674, isoform c n=1 Tax=Brugia malayi TaxID=6279 RepID=A0A1I9G1V3_BRUMA|nr:Bm9674, isoform c [Brugia malayi]